MSFEHLRLSLSDEELWDCSTSFLVPYESSDGSCFDKMFENCFGTNLVCFHEAFRVVSFTLFLHNFLHLTMHCNLA